MDDEAAIGRMNRRTHYPEETHALFDPKPAFITPAIDSTSFDILHGQARDAVVARPDIEHASCVRVAEIREDLALRFEARGHPRAAPAGF